MAKQSRNWARIKGPKFPTFHTFWLSAGHFGHVLLSFASFAALPERHGFALHTPSLPTHRLIAAAEHGGYVGLRANSNQCGALTSY